MKHGEVQIVDGGLVLYHRTARPSAKAIIAEGFKDSSGDYGIGRVTTGVWLSNVLLDGSEGGKGDVALKVVLDVRLDDLAQYEWDEVGKLHSEWQVPAAFIAAHRVSIELIDEASAPTRFEIER